MTLLFKVYKRWPLTKPYSRNVSVLDEEGSESGSLSTFGSIIGI